MKRFARDVAINVLANLIAAGMIYLGGVYVNILPKSKILILISLLLLVLGIVLGLVALAAWIEVRLEHRFGKIVEIIFYYASIIITFGIVIAVAVLAARTG